jgi:hypothetical protein
LEALYIYKLVDKVKRQAERSCNDTYEGTQTDGVGWMAMLKDRFERCTDREWMGEEVVILLTHM